ncbi:NADP-dependent glyceraldehyde-3-phosphate dehydrogenase [Spiroplasma turonicum]|uniref:Glyceraldehyde-3-phosphate dehydrogenase n=1 Tax=Spiroplasma turonicum TaxID=216946 RepID=A0A0K1P6H3_9MOLU|nr:NADP-dependent glyceraldehyde-3-phosphate dehydrogenase [Spiroplasma turonicum]AKU79472.1 glyceraldehyde-3-phosphate dehydrogenase [Spiroplasma turonicum]ALX70494.1 glyceraldehyde-3-phosphate dehydrogenase [Spiroplasma turonicum]
MKEYKAVINGEFIDNNEWLEIINPTDNSIAGKVTALKGKDINNAFESARKSQEAWENTHLLKRISILNNFKKLLIQNKNNLAEVMTSEIAKSLKDSLSEIDRTIELIEYTFEEAKRMDPLALTGEGMGAKNKLGIFSRVAKGVVLAISPFNYPFNLALAKIIPALVMGNTVVFKPATAGSLVGSLLGKLSIEANFPKGIFNVVTGRGREIGDLITMNKEIDMISFTGSVSIGNNIKEKGSSKDIVLELGGKDPALVLDDNNLESYSKNIIDGAFGYSGQRCTAIKRVITTNKIADKLVPLLIDKVNKLTIGSPYENKDITPVIDQKSADFIKGLVEDAKLKKATILTGDKYIKNLIYPTLIDNVTLEMRVAWEEPFGPILPIIRIDNIEEMIRVANESEFGLQASIFCADINNALQVAKRIKTGTVNINSKSQRGPDCFPFLGIKNSGQGVQGVRESLLSMTRYHGIVINY